LAANARCGSVKYHEADTIEADQAAESGEPQIPVPRLQDVIYGILRQPVFRTPDIETLLCADGWR
jgi:hypothetical protein